MTDYILAAVGIFACSGLLVQMIPESAGSMDAWLTRIGLLVLTWLITLVSLLVLAGRGSFSFAGDSKFLVIALHVLWGVACLVIALDVAASTLAIRMAIASVPVVIHLALALPAAAGFPLLAAALGCQCLGPGALFIYATASHTEKLMAEDSERTERQAVEAREFDLALKMVLDELNADTELEVFYRNTRGVSDSVRDQVVAAAIAKKPNLEAEIITALHGDSRTRWGARSLLTSPAIPHTQALADAVRDSILIDAGEISASSSDDQKNQAAFGAVTIAESFPEYKALFRPAMLRLRDVTGRPVKEPGRVTGREELQRWLQ